MVLVQEHLGRNRNAHDTLEARRRTLGDAREGASPGYHPHHGGHYDHEEDRSHSPKPMGPQAFGWHILKAALPPRYRPLTNVLKYSSEMNPSLWLEDYRLACRANGTVSGNFIIRNLPMFLADLAWTWLEHLPPNCVQSWVDLKQIFVGNFQGTYVHPGNPWDLKNC